MAEVMCRTLPDRGRRARFAFQRDGRGDPDSAHEAHVEFFRVGVACQIGFYLAALVGVSLVFINQNGLKGLALLIQHSVGSAP
jgi:hypothetical protein